MKVQVKLNRLERERGGMKVRIGRGVGKKGSNGTEKGTAENWE